MQLATLRKTASPSSGQGICTEHGPAAAGDRNSGHRSFSAKYGIFVFLFTATKGTLDRDLDEGLDKLTATSRLALQDRTAITASGFLIVDFYFLFN